MNRLSSAITLTLPAMTIVQKRRLNKKRIMHLGDIIDDSTGSRKWVIPKNEEWLVDLLPEDPPTGDDVLLWSGQFWRPYQRVGDLRMTDVVEIMHVMGDGMIEIAIWRMIDRWSQLEQHHRLPTSVMIDTKVLFAGHMSERVDQGGGLRNRCHFKNERMVPSPRTTVKGVQEQPSWLSKVVEFCDRQGNNYKPRIYTDGAYSERNHTLMSAFDPETIIKDSAGGVVIVHDGLDWRDRAIYALHIGDGAGIGADSAYTMEYLAVAIAMRMRNTEI